jgi:hypothetical protein
MSQDCGRIFARPVKTGKEVLRNENSKRSLQFKPIREKGGILVRKRSAQLHIRCREAKNSANR